MKLYEKLVKQKSKGTKLNFKEITAETLKSLFVDEEHSNDQIAELYDVKKIQVSFKKKKFGITLWDITEKHITKDYHDLINARNEGK